MPPLRFPGIDDACAAMWTHPNDYVPFGFVKVYWLRAPPSDGSDVRIPLGEAKWFVEFEETETCRSWLPGFLLEWPSGNELQLGRMWQPREESGNPPSSLSSRCAIPNVLEYYPG